MYFQHIFYLPFNCSFLILVGLAVVARRDKFLIFYYYIAPADRGKQSEE
jgi:hypothetical protein